MTDQQSDSMGALSDFDETGMPLLFLQDIGWLLHVLSDSRLDGCEWKDHLSGVGYMINAAARQVQDRIALHEKDLEAKGISAVTREPL
jgi:hypothetical protein